MRKLVLLAVLVAPVTNALAEMVDSPVEFAVQKLRPAPGLKVDLFAAEPDVISPIGISVDSRGRVFVSETRRYNTAALYVKQHSHWYYEDLACRKVQDRLDMARKYMGEKFSDLTKDSEVIRLLIDSTGAGKADKALIFADGFNDAADGCASGVLARGDEVWFTNVPKLWKLRDTNGDGKADERKVLQDGYGVRFGNSGHDLHGLCFGPDGKIYFSMGDRGLHIETEGKTFAYPDQGAELRCNPDGSDFEVFATGLRNPQGLTCDEYGNFWTCDNTMDTGDAARWVWVVQGSDSGWRTGYQYWTDPWMHEPIKEHQPLAISKLNTWMAEDLWHGKAAYILPPIGFISRGPCGVTPYPGTGLSERYNGHFFLCDFPGGIHSFGVKPKGSSFEMFDEHQFLWDFWPTDCKFGPDSKLYVCDWVYGFPMNGKGRIFRVFDDKLVNDPQVLEVKKLLNEGFASRPADELAGLLEHRDQRVRQGAQFELAQKKDEATLAAAAKSGKSTFARIHAIWGLGQIGAVAPVIALLNDTDAEVRAQAARVLGDRRCKDALQPLIERLKDAQPRVRIFAGIALGRLAQKEAVPALLEMLREGGNDAFLRHAGVMGLTGIADVEGMLSGTRGYAPSVRMGILLALRRLEREEVKVFLTDKDPALVLEAARAINDVPIPGAFDSLAGMLEIMAIPPGAALRAINANFRMGAYVQVSRLARYASRTDAPAAMRIEALGAMGAWGNPSQRDRLVGLWRPLPQRNPKPAAETLASMLPTLLKDNSEDVQVAAIQAAVRLNLESSSSLIEKVAQPGSHPAAVRVEALRALGKLHSSAFDTAVSAALNDADLLVRKEAIALAPQLKSPEIADSLAKLAMSDSPDDLRQTAISALGRIEGEKADQALSSLFDAFTDGKLQSALALDLLESADRKPALKERRAKYDESLPKDDPAAPYKVCLEGGDSQKGKRIFFENATVACQRCHRVNAAGGEVGPELTKVGGQRKREEILESILQPNKVIVQGYGQEVVVTKSNGVQVGRVKSENDSEIVLVLADASERKIAKDDVKKRAPALSAMPEDLAKLMTKRELRDLVEFLSGLK